MKELLKLFEEKPELGHEVEAMWERGASAQEVVDTLSGKGVAVDAAQIEELLSAMQAKRAEVIGASERVDKNQLKAIAGGDGFQTGGCTQTYYEEQCSATVEENSWCGSNDWCAFFSVTYTHTSPTVPWA